MTTLKLKATDKPYVGWKIGKSVEFEYKLQKFTVQEYQDYLDKNKYVWVCTNSITNKEYWKGSCRSTNQCIKIVKELIDIK